MSARTARWSPEGVYLALETSGPVGSVAIARGARVLARAFLPRTGEQSRQILPAIQGVLGQAALPMRAVSGVVVGGGPGSFTGARIAAATAKGIVHALDVPLWAFSSLAAGALSDRVLPRGEGVEGWWADGPGAGHAPGRYVLFDARGERVYAACYRLLEGDGGVEEIAPPRPALVSDLLAAPLAPGVLFAGDGAIRHRGRILASGREVIGPPAGVPTADALLRLLAAARTVPPIADPARWEPAYLKASSAEREREGAPGL